jgi:hypothetical protein
VVEQRQEIQNSLESRKMREENRIKKINNLTISIITVNKFITRITAFIWLIKKYDYQIKQIEK